MYICIHVCIYVYICVYIYIYIYICPHGDLWGTPLQLELRDSWALTKTPKGTKTKTNKHIYIYIYIYIVCSLKVTSAKGHCCA